MGVDLPLNIDMRRDPELCNELVGELQTFRLSEDFRSIEITERPKRFAEFLISEFLTKRQSRNLQHNCFLEFARKVALMVKDYGLEGHTIYYKILEAQIFPEDLKEEFCTQMQTYLSHLNVDLETSVTFSPPGIFAEEISTLYSAVNKKYTPSIIQH